MMSGCGIQLRYMGFSLNSLGLSFVQSTKENPVFLLLALLQWPHLVNNRKNSKRFFFAQ